MTLANIGTLLAKRGDFTEAAKYLERSLSLSRQVGDGESAAFVLLRLAMLSLEGGDTHTARARLADAMTLFREIRVKPPEFAEELEKQLDVIASEARS